MKLFTEGSRTRVSRRRYNETMYPFLDQSAWPSIQRVRELLEDWFLPYDVDKKNALAARFRSTDDHQSVSAFNELFVFAALKHLGLDVAIEPKIAQRALEFAAYDESRDLHFFVECTATGRRKADQGSEARQADVLEAADRVPAGPFLLEVEFQKVGLATPRLSELQAGLTQWMSTLDHNAALREAGAGQPADEWTWFFVDWQVRFAALPTLTADGADDEGSLGIIGPHGLDAYQGRRLRAALDAKASKYGPLDRPLLVTITSTEHQRKRDLMIALLGDPVWSLDSGLEYILETHRPNGVFGRQDKPRNVGMSAVLHGRYDPLRFADSQLDLVHHPGAAYPLPLGLFPFCEEHHFEPEAGKLVSMSPTTTVGEFFRLPHGWPFFERD